MARHLDVETWTRREAFEFFRGFDNPYFNVCTRLDVTLLLDLVRERPNASASLAYHYLALRLANEVEPFRYRLRGGKVVIHDVIHGGTTILLPNESFTFAYFEYDGNFDRFAMKAGESMENERTGDGALRPRPDDDAMVHFTTLPWISFTGFSHARNWRREDSVPKIAFGRYSREGGRVFLPISIEVHHALMDGLHVGRYVNGFEQYLADPASCLGG